MAAVFARWVTGTTVFGLLDGNHQVGSSQVGKSQFKRIAVFAVDEDASQLETLQSVAGDRPDVAILADP